MHPPTASVRRPYQHPLALHLPKHIFLPGTIPAPRPCPPLGVEGKADGVCRFLDPRAGTWSDIHRFVRLSALHLYATSAHARATGEYKLWLGSLGVPLIIQGFVVVHVGIKIPDKALQLCLPLPSLLSRSRVNHSFPATDNAPHYHKHMLNP